jgi:WD40 repeat protein
MKLTLHLVILLSFSIKLFAQTEQPIKIWTLAKSNYRDNASLLFTPSGFLIVGDGKDVRMLNTQSSKDVWLRGHGADVHLLSLNLGARHLLSASTNNDVKMWDLTTFKEVAIEDDGKNEKKDKKGKIWNVVVQGAKYLPNGKVKEGVYDADRVKNNIEGVSDLLRPKDRKFNPLKAAGFGFYHGTYNFAHFICDMDKAFEVVNWEVGSKRFNTPFTLPKSAYATDRMLFCPSGKLLGYGYSETSTAKIWSMETNKEIQTIPFCKRLLGFSPDNELVVTASDEGILMWNIAEGTNVRFLETDKKQDVRSFAFHPKDRYFAAALTDNETGEHTIALWDADFGKLLRTFQTSDKVTEGTLAFSPDGNNLAYRTQGDVVELWDIQQMMNEDRQTLGKNLLPKINWETPLSNLTVADENFDLKACIASGSKVRDVKIYVNDKLVNAKERGLKPVGTGTTCEYPLSMKVQLRQGANSVYISATNKAGNRYSESRQIAVGNAAVENKELTGRQIALIIGNADYVNGSKLANPVNDATDLSESLKKLGFEVVEKTNADLRGMEQVVEEFSKKLRYYDVAMVFYAGHGLQVEGENYLVPIDATLKEKADVKYKCFPLGMLISKMEGKARTNIVVLDACRNNPFERSWSRSAAGNGMAVVSAPKGTFIGFATSPGQTANDGSGKNGVYTSALLRHINTKSITIDQLFTRINNTVDELTSGAQVPWKTSSLSGDYYFTK